MTDSKKNTILVADDNDDVREVLRIYLEIHQYNVVEAKNGEEAVRAARAEQPDLILIDLNMPEVDGIQAIEEIRQNEELADIPILVNSADGTRGMEFFLNMRKFGKGYIEYLVKPLNYEELAKLINNLISKSQTGLAG